MSAGFTPGPWATTMDRGNHRRSCVSADGVMIAQAFDRVEADAEANARLIAAAPDYATACGLDLHPGEAQSCGPLAWLRSAIDTLSEDAVREAAQGDDPDAYFTMLTECRLLAEKLEAANAKARGES